jgi:hypothetical protein
MTQSEAIIDRISVAQAAKNLSISLRTLYRRCEAMGIVPERDGVNSYVTIEQVQKLRSPQPQTKPLGIRGVQVQRSINAVQLVQALAQLMPQPKSDPFAVQRALQEACDKGWLLTTEQLSKVLGISPRTVRNGGNRLGFRFERIGREWRVTAP